MAPDIANKLKATLFRRRRRQSEVSVQGDEGDSSSPPTTPGISQRRPSFPFPREPSSQTLTLSLELMTEDGEVGIGGCGGGDDNSEAGDSALTSNDAEQQRTRQHWRMWQKPKQTADAEKRRSVPDSAAFHLSPVSPVSPTSQIPVAPTEATTPQLSKHAQGYFDSIGEEKGANDDQQYDQHQHQGVDTEAAAAATFDPASDPASPAAISNLQHQALTGELMVQALPALDQRQPQRPHQLPASAGTRVQGQSPRRSLNSEEASRYETDQSQLDGQGMAVINSDQGTIAGTTDAASASPRITAADAGGTGTTSTGTGGAVVSAGGPIPGGDLQQNQKQQQRQVQKRPRQPAPPFSLPSPPLPTPSALLTFPPLAPPTPGPSILPSIPSLPSLDSIDEDESQSPSPSQSQTRSTYPQSSSQSQQQAPSASPAAAEHVAATGRGIDAPPTPGAGHGPLNLTSASLLPTKPPPASPLARVEAAVEAEAEAGLPLTKSSPTSVLSSAVPNSDSSAAARTSTRPPAPPRRASRDPNQTVTFDESADKSASANSSNRDALIATASLNVIGTPGAEAPPAVSVTSAKHLGPAPLSSSTIPSAPSIIAHRHDDLIGYSSSIDDIADLGDFDASSMAEQIPTKIWVMRPKASATQIRIRPGDLVDDVRDEILRKYGNSLGKTFDSPDLTLRIQVGEETQNNQRSRTLGPEEDMVKTLNAYYPSGQTVKDALVIEIPRTSTTPKPSPRVPLPHSGSASAAYYGGDDGRPSETGEGYFPPVGGSTSSPRLAMSVPAQVNGAMPHSMTVISSGHLPPIPPLPSPGGNRPRGHRDRDQRHDRQDYARTGRTHTPSPNLHNGGGSGAGGGGGSNAIPNSASSTAANAHGAQHYRSRHSHSRTHSSSSEHIVTHSGAMAKSPGHEMTSSARMGTPPPQRLSSPRLPSSRPKKSKRSSQQQQQQQEYHHTPSPSILTATVPPINVLIVEDNPINLKLLEAFVKRLKVRWSTAMNGRDAVKKWRNGGFHLVLMDIQLPGMNGLEATREIRRLERINNIGVFSTAPTGIPETTQAEELTEQDRLEGIGQFKSPVIIVALTASSLQSDRHEALASGCNDFLTKPVNFVWLERKVMEWGCMQALIDFEGWRKWKDLSAKAEAIEAATQRAKAQAYKNKTKKNRPIMSAS
ncbi:hypothetical protein Trihar35433_1913 [Trichoderma harzianum]|nr:hypothetical protein Trihar35433_1913 [Trichoderma harzianum]